jgi:FAD dependent oxidoreductase TIGR03364
MKSEYRYDDAVIGAGVLGLAHAYALARRGRRVVVFEREAEALGSSVRNFGMLWPMGQPFGPQRRLARKSLRIWLDVLRSAGLWHECSGSLHLAYRDDEAQVLREFVLESVRQGEPTELLSPARVCERARAVKSDGLQLALWSPVETCVDPREVIAGLPRWLSHRFGVDFRFSQPVTAVEPPFVHAGPERCTAGRVWICAGDELNILFAEQFQRCALVRCKLQMMRSEPYGGGGRIGPMLAGGLTLRHYASFRSCPSLDALCRRVADETPWFDRLGIHVMVAQNGRGELIIGDSHEYGNEIEIFDKLQIDDLVLSYLRTFLHAPELKISARWHGFYVKHATEPYIVLPIEPGTVTAVTGVGGAGMTLSFGLAEQVIARELGESEDS